ncbi:sacsin N-terminal ATP-binding-like domain-containing protein [Rhizobium ruizarguesonis]
MPDFRISPISIVNQIKSNLQERYGSGYPILKELLQNADDARALRFQLDSLPGWPSACNPLLRGPGLLVANDGFFRKEDEDGITSFGESSKATDSAAIGKFGFGQKAVFHLCDAFLVYARRENGETFSTVVNPFLHVVADGNITRQWEPPGGALDLVDIEFLRNELSANFSERHLVLWLPLRRERIQPAPDVSFSSNTPSPTDTIKDIIRPDDLRVVLTTLRHLKRVELLEEGELRCALELEDGTSRLLGPGEVSGGARSFSGAIAAGDRSRAPFVGREAIVPDGRLSALKCMQHWPKTITVLSSKPAPEKGEPHGAATLLRGPPSSTEGGGTAQLRISWAVFLPISDVSDIVIQLDRTVLGRFHLLLHGYFFLDSGRQHIEGIDAPAEPGEPTDASTLRRAWNAELRDSLVLPHLPALLRDALGSAMVTSEELAQLVSALARHEWFEKNRQAICRESSLARVLEAAGTPVWRVIPSEIALRPIPASVAVAPKRISDLFGSIGSWANETGVHLIVDDSTALSAQPIRWTASDLGSVFSGLSVRAFQSRELAPLLADFLQSAKLGQAERLTIGPHLVSVLRQAMKETTPLAPTEFIKSILSYVPDGMLSPLPASVEHRQVLRALAYAPANILPVRSEWLDESSRPPQLSAEDLKALLNALEPLIKDDYADQAATAALTLLTQARRNISELARDPEFASIKVLRARDVRVRSPVVLSLQTLAERSRAGLLFANSPQANLWLPLLVEALPNVAPLVVEGSTMQLLRDMNEATFALQSAGKDSAFALVNKAVSFGSEGARQRLLTELGTNAKDDPAPGRRLCAGSPEAGYSSAKLWTVDASHQAIERIATALIESSQNEFHVPSSIADGLGRLQREYLRIEPLGTANLETLFDKNIAAIGELAPTISEREAILETDLSNNLLIRLPIHERRDGAIGDGIGVLHSRDEWPVPKALQAVVSLVRPCRSPKARERQEQIIEPWSPRTQIEVALNQAEPHRFLGEILAALANLTSLPGEHLLKSLRAKPWLLADEQPIRPSDVLALPPTVDEVTRALLLKSGERPPFFPVTKLAIDVREHLGFAHLEEWVLLNRRESFEALALMIEDREIIGILGTADSYPIEEFTTLAEGGAQLGLPGWPLLGTVLISLKDNRDEVRKIVEAFASLDVSDASLTGTHFDSLAALAEENGRRGEAARRAYRHGFKVVSNWPADAARQVFKRTRVPTEAGDWRIGQEVVESGDGLDPRHILAREYASMLGRRETKHGKVLDTNEASSSFFAPNRSRGEITGVNLLELEARSADQQQSFLNLWKGRLPADLVIVYLGLIGRSESFRRVANGWATDATADVDTIWADLDNHFPERILYPSSLADEVDQRRFLIEPVAGEHVQAVTMSGDTFDVPLGGPDKGILIGNLHKTHELIRAADGKVRSLIKLPVRQVSLSEYSQKKASGIFRRFAETIASDCLWLDTNELQNALQEMLDKAIKVDQSTIEETNRLLRDRLPTILAELKLPTEHHSQKALREYQHEEGRLHYLSASAQKIEELKEELWRRVSNNALSAELLSAVRAKIADFGYSPSRVLFELFQNADDAYRQQDEDAKHPCFRVELLSESPGGFRIVHWGRRINHMGHDPDEGRRLGHDRDLLNMLLMNFSEKRPGDDLTGKFGLGFKSVHVLSDSVGIASGFIALRTIGGFLPTPWPEGIDAGENRKSRDGRKATVIEVPFSTDTAEKGAKALEAFKTAMTWLPAFARAIRRVEIEGDASVDCALSALLDDSAIGVITLSGRNRQRALRVDLSSGFCLLLLVGAAGPCAFSTDLRRLWNLAPLEEESRSGWLLNGPFSVDPGRTGLAGSIADQQEKFRKLGRALGDRLLKLHDLADADWGQFAVSLDLDTSKSTAWNIFWSHLFDVVALDFDDSLSRHLHAEGQGYSRLAGQHQVVPTRLPAPFASLVRASEAEHYTDGALSDPATLAKVRDWPALMPMRNRTVTSEIDNQLKKLGFDKTSALNMAEALRREMGPDKRLDFEHAERLGQVLALEEIEQEPISQERRQILEVAGQALFLARDGSWRLVRDLSSETSAREDEKLMCGFAPENALLDPSYRGSALEFFRTARSQSGYGPNPSLLLKWASSADTSDRQRAVLRYAVDGGQGRALADAMRHDLPSWVPGPLESLLTHDLLADWTEEDKKRLLLELGGHRLFSVVEVATPQQVPIKPEAILSEIYAWWLAEGSDLRSSYARRTYPAFFSPSQLLEREDRAEWFTVFALACFQSFGRTQDGQHRSFIEAGYREGWWLELAASRPPDGVQSWVERLERWSAPDQFDQQYLMWRRTFVDLYAIARWLDEYREIVLKLPRIIEDHGVISLNSALQPSYWAPAARLCIDAAPIDRSLGLGMNWMIREMVRHGVYRPNDEGFMAPYGWAPSQRVRVLMSDLGADVGVRADKEASREIQAFVMTHLGSDRARFDGDFDLPLQLITQKVHREALEACFHATDRNPPDLEYEEWEGDSE